MRTTNVLLWLSVVAFPSAAFAETCPPTAVVSGPKGLVRSLTQALMARGVQIEPAGLPPGACPALDVAVALAAAGLQVRITDPWGRRADRALANVLTAATLIEVWARMDLLASETSTTAAVDPTPLVGAEAPVIAAATTASASIAPAPAAAPVAEIGDDDGTERELATQMSHDSPRDLAGGAPQPSTLLLDVAGEVGIARDRRVWSGSALGACMRIGFTCVGALGRFAFSRGGDYRIDGLGLVTVPIGLGRFTLTPGVGVGAGVELERGQRRGGPDGSLDLRVEGRFGLGFRITDSLHAELGASASTSPRLRGRGGFLGGADDTIVRASLGIMWGSP